jgi:glutamyl-Q tRNA(Asp) synthetase
MLAAVASYLEARSQGGKWLVRIEDIDPPRERTGSAKFILDALQRYGFEWDGEPTFQSANRDAQEAAVERLLDTGLAYRCGCSRRDLADERQGPLGTIYPGNCRSGFDGDEYAVRVRTDDSTVDFQDLLQGRCAQRLESESGDFIILRRDGLIAYQLAVVVDDYLQGITEIVRGVDLLDSTPRQIWLQRLLGYPTPAYMHIPVAVNAAGQKLSKSTGAPAIPLEQPQATLVATLKALRQPVPQGLEGGSLQELWAWARANWVRAPLQRQTTIETAHFTLATTENGLR